MKSKKILSTIILIITILGFSTISNAALESKAGQNPWQTIANNQFVNIRKMETNGGTLGVSANIDETTYLDSSGNGIDVHMALATEWGTAALLAISDYGAYNSKGTVTDAGTKVAATTGNITGVFQMADSYPEFNTGVLINSSSSIASKICTANNRYRNEYTADFSVYHKGDALFQTKGWYNGVQRYTINDSFPIYFREEGLFGFNAQRTIRNGGWTDANGVFARACIVCGEGL